MTLFGLKSLLSSNTSRCQDSRFATSLTSPPSHLLARPDKLPDRQAARTASVRRPRRRRLMTPTAPLPAQQPSTATMTTLETLKLQRSPALTTKVLVVSCRQSQVSQARASLQLLSFPIEQSRSCLFRALSPTQHINPSSVSRHCSSHLCKAFSSRLHPQHLWSSQIHRFPPYHPKPT